MPAPIGLFASFDNLDQITPENIAKWLKVMPSSIQLENYLANRILYPQTIPMTDADMMIDLAILREALRINEPKIDTKFTNDLLGDNPFKNTTLRKILIPEKFLSFVPNLTTLTWVFVDGLLSERQKKDFFEDLWTVILQGESDEIVGSIILPQFRNPSGMMELKIEGKKYNVKSGSLVVLPCPKDRCEIFYKFNQGKALGKNENAVEIYGGRLGLMIDGRIG